MPIPNSSNNTRAIGGGAIRFSVLQVNGITILGQEQLAAVVDDFYANLLEASNNHVFTLDLDALGLPSRDLSHPDM